MLISWPNPGTTELHVKDPLIRAKRHVHTHVESVLARQFVAESSAAGDNGLRAVEALEVIPATPPPAKPTRLKRFQNCQRNSASMSATLSP
jgi:hypothetical protein